MTSFKHDKTVKLSPESLRRLELRALLTPEIIRYLNHVEKQYYMGVIEALKSLLESRDLQGWSGICGYLSQYCSLPRIYVESKDALFIGTHSFYDINGATTIIRLLMALTGRGEYFDTHKMKDYGSMSDYRIQLTKDLIEFLEAYLEIKNNDSN